MPLPTRSSAATIRIYRINSAHRPSEPQGGSYRLAWASRDELRHEAIRLWQQEEQRLHRQLVAPAFLVSNQIGPDLFLVSIQHPEAGVLKSSLIAIEA